MGKGYISYFDHYKSKTACPKYGFRLNITRYIAMWDYNVDCPYYNKTANASLKCTHPDRVNEETGCTGKTCVDGCCPATIILNNLCSDLSTASYKGNYCLESKCNIVYAYETIDCANCDCNCTANCSVKPNGPIDPTDFTDEEFIKMISMEEIRLALDKLTNAVKHIDNCGNCSPTNCCQRCQVCQSECGCMRCEYPIVCQSNCKCMNTGPTSTSTGCQRNCVNNTSCMRNCVQNCAGTTSTGCQSQSCQIITCQSTTCQSCQTNTCQSSSCQSTRNCNCSSNCGESSPNSH